MGEADTGESREVNYQTRYLKKKKRKEEIYVVTGCGTKDYGILPLASKYHGVRPNYRDDVSNLIKIGGGLLTEVNRASKGGCAVS